MKIGTKFPIKSYPNKGMRNKKHSEATKQKLSEINRGKNLTEETKMKISKSHKGKKLSEEHKRKISLKLSGEGNPMYGRKNKWGNHTKETKQLLREKNMGDKNPSKRLEVRKKISKSKMGKSWVEFFGAKKAKEMKKAMSFNVSGDKNPSWINGKSFEPYPITFNNKFKRFIRKRDNYVCLKCGIHQEKLPRALDVHHIDYIKENTIKENCCALCRNCNLEVNINRKHWTKFFQSLLNERYGYEYTDCGEIILNLNGIINE